MTLALQAEGITKRFPGVLANDNVDFTLHRGEIHALLGENGAGKSTLMNILYGLYQPDEGKVNINGSEITLTNPHDAIAHGIGMVHQHFMLVPTLSVAENIMLGQEATARKSRFLGPLATLDRRGAARKISDLSQQYGLEVDPNALVSDLTVGAQQRVEIIKALYRSAEILILDEPTAVLTPQESDDLFVIMRGMVNAGKSIVFISHKLREVFAVADRISVMRAGRMVGQVQPSAATTQMLAEMMVGRQVILQLDKSISKQGQKVLEINDLHVADDRKHTAVDGVSFDVFAGEILGIAGVQGNGQTELTEAITGLRRSTKGSMKILGHDTTHATPRQVIESGAAHIPEDRQKHGLVLSFNIEDNLVLCSYYRAPYAHGIGINFSILERNATDLVQMFDVRAPSTKTLVETLSGGNQQKVIVAREMSRQVKLVIANQPTRGLDVGSIEFIHGRIIQARDKGAAVLLVSAELDEVMSLSDRIAVMYRGRVLAIVDARTASREQLGLLMAGISHR